jgi:hypothetical protein
MIESVIYGGLGLSLDSDTSLLVINADDLAQRYEVGSFVMLSKVQTLGGNVGFERLRTRLLALVGTGSLGSLSDRAVRHALLYILEAHDPEVRRERLEILKATLTIKAP